MDKRYLVVVAAVVLAAGLLAGAYYVGGPAAQSDAANWAGDAATSRAELAELPGVDREALNDAEESPIYGVDNFDIFVDDGETVTRLRGSRANPRENFISDVEEPVAEVTFSPTRVLTISADSGTFFHPGNVPQRGEFHANTVLTLYEAPPYQPLDKTDPGQVQLRLYLDGVTSFNREEGIVSTEGPVRLVRPDADFTGRGLDLTYNNLTQRIERMVIHHADELRLAAGELGGDDPAAAVDAAAAPARSPSTGGDASRTARPERVAPQKAATPADTDSNAPSPTFYQAVMTDNVRLRSTDANLAGESLTVLFSLAPASDAEPDRGEKRKPLPNTGPEPTARVEPKKPKDAGQPSGASPKPAPPRDTRALLIPSGEDIIIHWDGELVLTPIDAAPPELAGPDDTRFTLTGRPARLDTDRDERVTAASLGYSAADGRVFAWSDETTPLSLTTPDLGELTGSSLSLQMLQNVGQIVGPGRLDAPEQQLTVDFTDRLDLVFAADAGGSATVLETATFVGQVHAVAAGMTAEEQLDLRADTLALSLDRPAATASEPDPAPQPSRLVASGNVRAVQPGNRLAAESLDITLAPPLPSTDPTVAATTGTEPDGPPRVEIARLRALNNVRVELTEEATTLAAHALDADPRASRLELFGQPDADATLTRDDATLTGQHLILLEDTETVDVLGPGTFAARLNPDVPDERLDVAWQRSMAFDNRSGRAHFLGNVDATSTTATDDTRLQAHDLSLTFDPQAMQQDDAANPNTQPPTPNTHTPLRHALATAIPGDPESEVTFSARTFAPAPGSAAPGSIEPGQPRDAVTRLTLIGPRLTFTNEPPNLEDDSRVNDHIAVERVVVDGKGKMLLEDFRPPPPPEDAQASDGGDSTGVLLAGPGVTLFAWTDRLTLDAQANDMLIEGDVWMVHKPLEDSAGEPIKLDAQRLLADLTETGGLGAWVGDAAPTARVRQIDADGAVRVTQGDFNVVSDHLQYVEADRDVLLWADPGRGVTLTRDDQPEGSTTAAALKWDLDTNVFRGINPDSGVIPLR